MIFEVKCDKRRTYELMDRTHIHNVSFIVLDFPKMFYQQTALVANFLPQWPWWQTF